MQSRSSTAALIFFAFMAGLSLHASMSYAAVDDGSIAYAPWIDEQIEGVAGDNAAAQGKAAEQLDLVIPTSAVRAKVLAALEPHLKSDDKELRIRCIQAYGHWATADQTPRLLSVVGYPANPPEMSGDEPGWAYAAAALLTLNPKAAETAIKQRESRNFFRDPFGQRIIQIASGNSPAQPLAFSLLKRMDPSLSNSGAMPLEEAEKMVASDSADQRGKGAHALRLSLIDPAKRQEILALLKPHLNGNDGWARVQFVQAFAHWATAGDVKQLREIVGFPTEVNERGHTGHEECWVAATLGLVRLDPIAARQALTDRSKSFAYRLSLEQNLTTIAQGYGPMQANACWLRGQVDPRRDRLPLPPGFSPLPCLTYRRIDPVV